MPRCRLLQTNLKQTVEVMCYPHNHVFSPRSDKMFALKKKKRKTDKEPYSFFFWSKLLGHILITLYNLICFLSFLAQTNMKAVTTREIKLAVVSRWMIKDSVSFCYDPRSRRRSRAAWTSCGLCTTCSASLSNSTFPHDQRSSWVTRVCGTKRRR